MARDWTQDEVIKDLERVIEKQDAEIERLRTALKKIADFDLYGDYSNAYEIPKIARAALKEGE